MKNISIQNSSGLRTKRHGFFSDGVFSSGQKRTEEDAAAEQQSSLNLKRTAPQRIVLSTESKNRSKILRAKLERNEGEQHFRRCNVDQHQRHAIRTTAPKSRIRKRSKMGLGARKQSNLRFRPALQSQLAPPRLKSDAPSCLPPPLNRTRGKEFDRRRRR